MTTTRIKNAVMFNVEYLLRSFCQTTSLGKAVPRFGEKTSLELSLILETVNIYNVIISWAYQSTVYSTTLRFLHKLRSK